MAGIPLQPASKVHVCDFDWTRAVPVYGFLRAKCVCGDVRFVPEAVRRSQAAPEAPRAVVRPVARRRERGRHRHVWQISDFRARFRTFKCVCGETRVERRPVAQAALF